MAVVAFTSLCSTNSLCSVSSIVSIFLIILTTVSSIISFEYNACRSALTPRNGFHISSIEVTKALSCLSKANSTAGTCPLCLIALSQQLAMDVLSNDVIFSTLLINQLTLYIM